MILQITLTQIPRSILPATTKLGTARLSLLPAQLLEQRLQRWADVEQRNARNLLNVRGLRLHRPRPLLPSQMRRLVLQSFLQQLLKQLQVRRVYIPALDDD